MERKEPTLSLHPETTELKSRVRLTWGEVRALAEISPQEPTLVRPETVPAPRTEVRTEAPAAAAFEAAAPVPPAEPAAPAQPTPAPTPAPAPAPLTDDDLRRLAEMVAPKIEQALREHLREALDMSLGNALQRARSDVERSIGPIVQQTVMTELRRIDVSALKPQN